MDMDTQLSGLRARGVNALIGCTYYATGVAMLESLERLDYSPLYVALCTTVDQPAYASKVASGWWQGTLIAGISVWHPSLPGVGSLSGMSSSEFAQQYADRYGGAVPTYQAAATFAAGVALTAAVEAADSLNSTKVAAALRTLVAASTHSRGVLAEDRGSEEAGSTRQARAGQAAHWHQRAQWRACRLFVRRPRSIV